jgi:hypothetical protein
MFLTVERFTQGDEQMADNKIVKFKDRFFEIAGSGRYYDTDKAHRIVDAMAAPCSPDHYDEMIAKAAQSQLGILGLETPAYIAWAQEIITAAETNAENDHDLRGMIKNIHHR